MSYQNKERGFTIVELLIVIVVIGILAGLVITTFTGIQKKARNSERQTDINAIQSQVEAYYAQNSKYPSLANIVDTGASGFIKTQMKGLDVEALRDPSGPTGQVPVVAPATGVYAYTPTPAGCDNATGGVDCAGYTLVTTFEGQVNGVGTLTKTALN